jgi:hypothetical protein
MAGIVKDSFGFCLPDHPPAGKWEIAFRRHEYPKD